MGSQAKLLLGVCWEWVLRGDLGSPGRRNVAYDGGALIEPFLASYYCSLVKVLLGTILLNEECGLDQEL